MTRINLGDDAPAIVEEAAARFEAAADQLAEIGGTEAIIRGIYTEARLDALTQAVANMLSPEQLAQWTADTFDSAAETMGETTEALHAHNALDAADGIVSQMSDGEVAELERLLTTTADDDDELDDDEEGAQ